MEEIKTLCVNEINLSHNKLTQIPHEVSDISQVYQDATRVYHREGVKHGVAPICQITKLNLSHNNLGSGSGVGSVSGGRGGSNKSIGSSRYGSNNSSNTNSNNTNNPVTALQCKPLPSQLEYLDVCNNQLCDADYEQLVASLSMDCNNTNKPNTNTNNNTNSNNTKSNALKILLVSNNRLSSLLPHIIHYLH